MKRSNYYERKYFRKKLMQSNPDNDFSKVITEVKTLTLILLLIKIAIQVDMRKKGISFWDEYAENLLKQSAPLNPVNPMP